MHKYDGCVICLVRQLTEGTPQAWAPVEEGDQVTGVVLRKGEVPARFDLTGRDMNPFVDLMIGDDRTRVLGLAASLRREIEAAEIQIGDTVTVTYLGVGVIERGKHAGMEYRKFSVDVTRGHH